MRDAFSEWYWVDDNEIADFVVRGRIVLDANVLLDLYRYSEARRTALMNALEQEEVRSRLFLPYQAALEYHQNRMKVAYDHDNEYAKVAKLLDAMEVVVPLDATLDAVSKIRDPGVSSHLDTAIQEAFENALSEARRRATQHIQEERGKNVLPPGDLRLTDPIRDRIERLFRDDGQLGSKPTPEREQALQESWKARKDAKPPRPPGTKDTGKTNGGRGDFHIWEEMKQLATDSSLPVLFVSADDKEDWSYKPNGHTVGPLPELRAEFLEATGGQPFHKVKWTGFLVYLNKHLKAPTIVDDDTIAATRSSRPKERRTKSPSPAFRTLTDLYGTNSALSEAARMAAVNSSIALSPAADAAMKASGLAKSVEHLRRTHPELFGNSIHRFLRDQSFYGPPPTTDLWNQGAMSDPPSETTYEDNEQEDPDDAK